MAEFDLDALLAPLSGANPAGADLRYAPEYDKIKTARRAADDKISGRLIEQSGAGPEQDWQTIEKLASELLAKRSKDLQLAVWLLEVETRIDGFDGATFGLELVRQLIEKYWDNLHPQPDEDDDDPLGTRVGAMDWINTKLPALLKAQPLTSTDPPYGLVHYEVTQETGAKKQALLDAGWPNSEQFEEALNKTAVEDLQALLDSVKACQEQLKLLGEVVDKTFVIKKIGPDGTERTQPILGFNDATKALDECHWVLDRNVSKRAPRQPVEAESGGRAIRRTTTTTEGEPAPTEEASVPAFASGPVGTREDALKQLDQIAGFLMTADPADPTPYLLSRAVAFGPLFAFEAVSEALPLPSPPTELRQRLRTLSANGEWNELVQEGERHLRTTPKQAWIDLQRYTVKALNEIGYPRIAAAVEHQVRTLLGAYSELADTEFEDGTPTANQESRQWLDELMPGGGRPPALLRQVVPMPVEPRSDEGEGSVRPPSRRDQAIDLANTGQTGEALALLQELVQTAVSGRERFLYKLDLAEICLESGRAPVAYPILQELAAMIDRAQLADWEDKEVVGRAWSALVRCCRQLEDNADAQTLGNDVFNRLCRLDITMALSIDSSAHAASSRWSRR
jgi:type VI secretion system protein ImpA